MSYLWLFSRRKVHYEIRSLVLYIPAEKCSPLNTCGKDDTSVCATEEIGMFPPVLHAVSWHLTMFFEEKHKSDDSMYKSGCSSQHRNVLLWSAVVGFLVILKQCCALYSQASWKWWKGIIKVTIASTKPYWLNQSEPKWWSALPHFMYSLFSKI